MPTCVITKARPDSSFDDVGMNYRRIVNLKTKRGTLARVVRQRFIKHGDRVRLEWYYAAYDVLPYLIEYGFLDTSSGLPLLDDTINWKQRASLDD